MQEYIRSIILEQKNRIFHLKTLIPRPLTYTELLALSERCNNILNENIRLLDLILEEIDQRDTHDVRDILREVRRRVREIEMVEYFGISALYRPTSEVLYLNKLMFRIHQEINLPLIPPTVACTSNMYYYFHSFTNVIFVPIGETNSLSHLPDVFHEIGHEVLSQRDMDLRLRKLKKNYEKAIQLVTNYYQDLLRRKIRETGPRDIPYFIINIHSVWKEYWLTEFFCDLFALYTLGPAYAWAHFHLTMKKTENVYRFNPFSPSNHPSDDSRMALLLIGLDLLNLKDEALDILTKWKDSPLTYEMDPEVEYQYAYPKQLLQEIASLFLDGLTDSGFKIITPEVFGSDKEDSIITILNEAWAVFWNNPSEYKIWEKKAIEKIKSIL